MYWRHSLTALAITLLVALTFNSALGEEGNKEKPDAEQRKAAEAQKMDKYNQAVAAAKISLADGVTKAEAHSGGKAVAAMYHMGPKDALVIDVTCLVDGKKQRCMVNAETGEVMLKTEKPKGEKPNGEKVREKMKEKKEKQDKAKKDEGEEKEVEVEVEVE